MLARLWQYAGNCIPVCQCSAGTGPTYVRQLAQRAPRSLRLTAGSQPTVAGCRSPMSQGGTFD